MSRFWKFWGLMDAYGDWLDEPDSFRVSVIRMFGSVLALQLVVVAAACGIAAAFGLI